MSQIIRGTRVIALVVAALALGVGVSVAQQRPFAEGGITVYDDVNFRGAVETFHDDVPDLRDVRLNDRISSLEVAPGESWEVCENVNYSGRCVVVSGSDRDLRTRGLNDTITSLRRVSRDQDRRDRNPIDNRDYRTSRDSRDSRDFRTSRDDGGPGGITVYDDVNFQGAMENFRSDVPDLREFRLNDRISSLQLPPGESWEVCENVNYGGRCVVVSESDSDLRTRGLSDNITSLRRVSNRDGRRD